MAFDCEQADSTQTGVALERRMLTLILRLTSIGKGTSSIPFTVPASWTFAQFKKHLIGQISDTFPMITADDDVSLMIHDKPLLGSVKICEVGGLKPYTVITCQIGQSSLQGGMNLQVSDAAPTTTKINTSINRSSGDDRF